MADCPSHSARNHSNLEIFMDSSRFAHYCSNACFAHYCSFAFIGGDTKLLLIHMMEFIQTEKGQRLYVRLLKNISGG